MPSRHQSVYKGRCSRVPVRAKPNIAVARKTITVDWLDLVRGKVKIARGDRFVPLTLKVRALEMLTRNSATNASIEQQFSEVMAQMRRVDRLGVGTTGEPLH